MSEPENSIHIQFEDTQSLPTIIKVFGVGGGGATLSITCSSKESTELTLLFATPICSRSAPVLCP